MAHERPPETPRQQAREKTVQVLVRVDDVGSRSSRLQGIPEEPYSCPPGPRPVHRVGVDPIDPIAKGAIAFEQVAVGRVQELDLMAATGKTLTDIEQAELLPAAPGRWLVFKDEEPHYSRTLAGP